MIFVSAQPDELMFAWQTEVQLKRYQQLEVDLTKVYVLVGFKDKINTDNWKRIIDTYPTVHVLFYRDERESSGYVPSIRPFLLKTFFKWNVDLQNEYMYYCDSDTVLTEVPAFAAMEDDRWHVSKADYISWNYIEEKKSPRLMRDMLNSVGIPEEIVKSKQQEVGGVQYFINETTPEFWQKVEQDCERMWKTYHSNFNTYRQEFAANTGRRIDEYDFQIWCVDMWCIYWNALLVGRDVYVNPELTFAWPKHSEESLQEDKIYHDTGINDRESNQWFHKGSFKNKTPFTTDLSKLGYTDQGTRSAQRFYLDIIEEISKDISKDKTYTVAESPVVSCLMTTYGRFECVERSITLWLLQDYPNKELVILNTAPKKLELHSRLEGKGIRVINSEFQLGTQTPYTNVGQIRQDVISQALGEYYICWDDDDLFLPWHISNGMKYIIENNKTAWMPKQSFWTPNAGEKFEYASNSMEASCIIKLSDIKRFGFLDSNGGEHLSWRRGLVEEGILDENINVYPFESYVYNWGEDIAAHKQSGSISSDTCFEDHKVQSTDFGVRELDHYSPIRIKIWFRKLVRFVNNPQFTNKIQPYL